MMPSIDIPNTRLIGKRFKIKKLQYNTYEVDHSEVKGEFRLIALPLSIFEVPTDLLPEGTNTSGFPFFMIGSQTVAGFVNTMEKKQPKPMQNIDIKNAIKSDITRFIIMEQSYEPWNEFILQGDPPLIIKTKTILTRLEWFRDHTDSFGDPALSASHNTTHSVTHETAGEGGMP
jgi:hypothetical protein